MMYALIDLKRGVIAAKGSLYAMRKLYRERGGVAAGWTVTKTSKPLGAAWRLRVRTLVRPRTAEIPAEDLG